METMSKPQFRDLTVEECHALLSSKNVGRIAFALHDRVDIQPTHYVTDGEWLFGRTSGGSKLSALVNNPWCAFETDDVRDLFDWSSVVIKGRFSIIDPKVGSLHTYQRAEKVLRQLVPGTFSVDDPASHRNVVWGIIAHEMTGRAAGR